MASKPSGTAAAAANLLIAMTALQAPMGSALASTQPEPSTRAFVRAATKSTYIKTFASCCQGSTAAKDIGIDTSRETTLQEKLIGEIRAFSLLEHNWDGEGSLKPLPASLREAVAFSRLIQAENNLPEPMLLASGHSALLWDKDGLYADLEFLGDGRIAYFIKKQDDRHKGVVSFNSGMLPSVFVSLLEI